MQEPAIRVIMFPRDTNGFGTIFGGVILSYIDLAGAVVAHKYAPRRFVTKALHEVEFVAPVYVGDLVSFYAEVVRVGRTSLTTRIVVEAERGIHYESKVKVTEAEVIYVSVDEQGEPTPILEK
jgi:acyl-CoA thioesterase YciA